MGAKIADAKAKPLPPGVYTPVSNISKLYLDHCRSHVVKVITLYDDTPAQPVNLEAMYTYCQYLVNSGMHGLVYLGTNGELALLTHEERQNIIRTACKAVTDLGLPDYPIVAGISAQSTVETIQFAKEAAEAGAGWGLLLPPSYWAKALSSAALIEYYRDVADASPIPVVIYNASLPSQIRIVSAQLLTRELVPRRDRGRGSRLGPAGGAGVAPQHRGDQADVRQRGQAGAADVQVRAAALWRLRRQQRLPATDAARGRQRLRDGAGQLLPQVDGQDLRLLGRRRARQGARAAGPGRQRRVGLQEVAVVHKVRRLVVRRPADRPGRRKDVQDAQALRRAERRAEEVESRDDEGVGGHGEESPGEERGTNGEWLIVDIAFGIPSKILM